MLKHALALVVLTACSRTPSEAPAKRTEAAVPLVDARAATTVVDAGPTFLVRIHRYAGGPGIIDHTVGIATDGTIHVTGIDEHWCRPPRDDKPVDTRAALEPPLLAEIRALVADASVTGYPSANRPARAPEHDGVAADVEIAGKGAILVDGVHDATGPMLRLLDLDRELAAKYGKSAKCP